MNIKEVEEHFGFVVVACQGPRKMGDLITVGSSLRGKPTLVVALALKITSTASLEEYNEMCLYMGVPFDAGILIRYPYLYKGKVVL